MDLLREVGAAVAEELKEFNVSVWLAPGMNIHRNPLCGRNFEYFSEDPLLSGMMAAAITRGVQADGTLATTIKHYACNNRENERHCSDSVISERALREIYLHTFEVAVRECAPKALMTSYNTVNGVHAANNVDLVKRILRQEWGYQGLVMTDWSTTGAGGSTADGCIRCENDLVMPGTEQDIQEVLDALRAGTLTREQLQTCAARVIRLAMATAVRDADA